MLSRQKVMPNCALKKTSQLVVDSLFSKKLFNIAKTLRF